MYKGLNEFVAFLKEKNQLSIIDIPVSTHLEITEITDRVSKAKGPALLFNNNGSEFPLLINAFGSDERMLSVLNLSCWSDFEKKISELFSALIQPRKGLKAKIGTLKKLKSLSSVFPVEINRKGKCQEIIHRSPDLSILPVLHCWPLDAGPFITLPVVHTINPETGIRNVGMYRMQVFDKNTTGMHWHMHKGSARHYDEYKKLGKRMPVSVCLGGDPIYTYVASAPLPENIDEYILAGFLRNKAVTLVKSITNDIYVPEDADFVIEGYIDTSEPLRREGPFGDHTGFYSLADDYPVFHVTCITHRKNAIYPTTIVGIPPMEDAYMGKATEKLFLPIIKKTIAPEVFDMHMPPEGVFHNLTLISIKKNYEGQPHKVMNALWGAGQMMFNKIFAVFEENISLNDYEELAKLLCYNVDSVKDIVISKGPADVLDHSSQKFAFGGKIGFDATSKNINTVFKASLNKEKLLNEFPEIIGIDDRLIVKNIPIAFIKIEKKVKQQTRNLFYRCCEMGLFSDIRFVVFLSTEAEIGNFSLMFWRFASNYDPDRDTYIHEIPSLIIGLDGTEKIQGIDNFQREWPPVICMSENIIKKIDAIWESLRIAILPKTAIIKQ